jgi:putative salt-induced outer membrane protein YdiY
VHKKLAAGLFVSLLLVIPMLADQIVLKNGDRLTGSITKSDGKSLVIKTDYAGDVTVKFDAIQSLTSSGDLNVTLGGKTAVGSVTTSGDDVIVATKTGGPVEAPKASVSLVRSPAEQAAYEKSLHPGFGQGWAGGANLGFALTAGNSETKNLNIGLNATRTGFHDKLTLYETSVYAATSKLALHPIPSQTTANSNGGGFRYDHDFTPRVFGFGSADFFNNSLQNLDLRYILGGGIGFHAIKTPNTTLDLLAGINYTHESFSDLVFSQGPPEVTYNHSDSSAALTVGDSFMHKLGKNSVFTQSLLLYPSFSQVNINPAAIPTFPSPDNVRIFRGAVNLGFVTKIHKWLGWQVTLADVFDNHPLASSPAIERNDITMATGLNFSFTH